MLQQNGHFLEKNNYIVVKGELVRITLPEELRLPVNLTYEKMVHELAKIYNQDPDVMADTKTQYDYYMMKVLEAQNYASEQFIQLTLSGKK